MLVCRKYKLVTKPAPFQAAMQAVDKLRRGLDSGYQVSTDIAAVPLAQSSMPEASPSRQQQDVSLKVLRNAGPKK